MDNMEGSPPSPALRGRVGVEICYVFEQKPILLQQSIKMGATIAEVLVSLGFEIQTLVGRIGIFGKQKPLDNVLKAGDRIEIYDPLLLDPKEARRLRAAQPSLSASRHPQQ